MTKQTQIFEILAPGEVLIMYKEDDCLTYIVNDASTARFKKTCLEKSDE